MLGAVELRHLRYFVAVAEELNFTRAAARLNTAQPSLSQQIRRLEREVGVQLLERSNRRVLLTAAGRVFLREARELLNHAERAVKAAVRANAGQMGTLSVGVMPAAEIEILPRILPALAARLPDVRLSLHSVSFSDALVGLRNQSLDISFAWAPIDEPNVKTYVVLKQRVVVALPARHPLARRRRVPLEELRSLPCVVPSRRAPPGLHDAIEAIQRLAGSAGTRTSVDADTVFGTLNMVRANLGFALLPEYVKTILPERVIVRPLDWQLPLSLKVLMAHRADDHLPAIDGFARVVLDVMGHNVARKNSSTIGKM
jgi:LysR family transcriptional regulator, hca operon transcriptional activator